MSKPAKCITVDAARRLRNQWQSTRGAYYRLANGGKQDCSDVVWGLEELEEYLKYVKDEAAKLGFAKPGIRVYFGAYDDGGERATLFFAPTETALDDSDNIYTIDPFNVGGGGWPPNNY